MSFPTVFYNAPRRLVLNANAATLIQFTQLAFIKSVVPFLLYVVYATPGTLQNYTL